jgi:hypothetical protein
MLFRPGADPAAPAMNQAWMRASHELYPWTGSMVYGYSGAVAGPQSGSP